MVEISDNVLLDESPPELTSIEINAGGSLVFSPDGDYTLVVGFMMLHGALYIGSEDCKFTAKAKIILKGESLPSVRWTDSCSFLRLVSFLMQTVMIKVAW